MDINAFAHAFYENHPEIEINIHPGLISIFNPGTFPVELTPNDFINRIISSLKEILWFSMFYIDVRMLKKVEMDFKGWIKCAVKSE